MVRLIDADAVYKILESCEIRKATIGNPLTDWEYGYTCGIERAESEIECASTIDAIPVSWIKENKNLARTVGAWQYELFLETLLKDWEEEEQDEYVTLHHDDIHFKDKESEKAFYDALAERKEE